MYYILHTIHEYIRYIMYYRINYKLPPPTRRPQAAPASGSEALAASAAAAAAMASVGAPRRGPVPKARPWYPESLREGLILKNMDVSLDIDPIWI